MIVDRIKQRASSWSSKFLSAAGKVIMLIFVLATMTTYSMSCFKLPGSLYKRIQSALKRFWWDDTMEKKKMYLVSWKTLTKGKRDPGLGFRDLQCFNDVLLAKLSWQILTKPTCLLAKLLLDKYCHKSSFLDSKTPASCSHGWRGICLGRDLLRSQLGRVLGDGTSLLIWKDPWLSLSTPSTPIGPRTENNQNLKVSHLISPVSLDWDREKILQTLPELVDDILEIKLSSFGAKDYYAWLPSKDGIYNTKSGYFESLNGERLLEENHQQGAINRTHQGFEWTREIWNVRASPKTKFFLWKLMRGALPLGENLKAIHIIDVAGSTLCAQEETRLGAFLQVPFCNKDMECSSIQKLNLSWSYQLTEISHRSLKITHLSAPFRFSCRTSPSMDCLGNLVSSKSEDLQQQDLYTDGNLDPHDLYGSRMANGTAQKKIPTRIKRRHDADSHYCFTDAAWTENSKTAGLGWNWHKLFRSLNRPPSF